MAFRVPTPNVSVVDLTVRLEKPVSLFTNLHDKNGFSWPTSTWHLFAFLVSSADYRPSMMISRKWSRLQLMDPWRAFWDTQRTRYAHQIVKVVSVKVLEKSLAYLCVCAGCVHWLQWGLSLIYLWCWCWHRPQRSLCQAGHMVRFCLLDVHLENSALVSHHRLALISYKCSWYHFASISYWFIEWKAFSIDFTVIVEVCHLSSGTTLLLVSCKIHFPLF